MWILEAVSEIPFKKPFLILAATLGAGFLLLAYAFSLNPLRHPAIYLVLALDLYLLYAVARSAVQAILFLVVTALLAYVLNPQYPLLFAFSFAFAAGKFNFRESFRIWKWLVASVLFYVSLLITSVWQQMHFLDGYLPFPLQLLVPAIVFAFCAQFSLAVYLLKKDAVQEAMDSYSWETRTESSRMAIQVNELYQQLKAQVEKHSGDRKIKEEFKEFTEKTIHLCHRLQEISRELSKTDETLLQQQIEQLEERLNSVSDLPARRQYEQALGHKRKQQERQDALRLQAERHRAQALSSISALENIRFAYTNRQLSSASDTVENLEFLMNLADNRADNVYDASEAYLNLVNTEGGKYSS